MITTLGILVILTAIAGIVWNNVKKNFDESDAKAQKYNQNVTSPYDKKQVKNFPAWPIPVKSWILGIVGVLILCLNGMFFWANPGTAYAVQYPWGGDKMVSTQGIKFQGWGRTIPISYEISLKDVIVDSEKGERVSSSEDGIYNRSAKLWEFSDAIKARIATAVVIGINVDDPEAFLDMADRNRSEGKLIYGRVLPNIDAAIKNTAKLMDAQEYISGRASEFDRYFRDQLENGMYIVEEYYEEQEPEVIGDTTIVRQITGVQVGNKKQLRYRIKRDDQGNILRDTNSNSLTQYGIQFYQAQVTSIDWEDSFDDRLQLQKEQVAQTQLEKQEAEKEYYRAQKEIAKGEADKAQERARLEKEQIKQTIEAETQAKVARQNVIAEREILEVERLRAESKRVAADAQEYENRKLVQAGLTPQQRVEFELKRADLVSKNLAGMNIPQNLIIGGNGENGGNSLEALLPVVLMKELNKDN